MNIVAYVAYDSKRNGFLLYFNENRGFWFLYDNNKADNVIETDESINLTAVKAYIKVTSSCECEFVKIFRVDTQHSPSERRVDYTVTYYLFKPIKSSLDYYKNGLCNFDEHTLLDFSHLKNEGLWFTEKQIESLASLKALMGLEPVEFLRSKSSLISEDITTHLIESTLEYIKVDVNGTDEEQLIASARFNFDTQEMHFKEFLRSSFPSNYLSILVFVKMFSKYKKRFNLNCLFNAFDVNRRKYLSYKDYVLGMAALSVSTNHGGLTGEMRCKYIFRYYNTSCTGEMTFSEFKALAFDVQKARRRSLTESELEKFAKTSFVLFTTNGSSTISMSSFLSVIGQLKFRGTSLLFRIGDMRNFKSHVRRIAQEESTTAKVPPYHISPYVVVLKPYINNNKIIPLNDSSYSFAVSRDSRLSLFTDQQTSINTLLSDSIQNRTLAALRIYEKYASLSNSHNYWKELSSFDFGKSIIHLCKSVEALLLKQPRFLKICSPCYITGDIHGNIGDLLNLEKLLWRNDMNIFPANVLFLGDYVDRGNYGVEVVAYLFAQKIIAPDKWFMIRGNHELRGTQTNFNFYDECCQKFGASLGAKIWEKINCVFDVMPFAALIDEKILCVHGGIPNKKLYSGTFEDAVLAIPVPLKEPESTCSLAWELMWNDPSENFEEDSNFFTNNTQRGTGSCFSKKALMEFLSQQNFSHLLRAHELKDHGFEIQAEGKMITIFSSSDYCNSQNDSAIVLCDSRRIIIMKNVSQKQRK